MIAAPQVTIVNIPNSGMELISGSSAQFTDIIANYLGLDALSVLDPVLPYSVLVKNNSSASVQGIGMLWDRKEAAGTSVRNTIMFMEFIGGSIRPGDSILVTPLSGLSVSMRQGTRPPTLRDPVLLSVALSHVAQRLEQNSTEVVLTLDSMVFSDNSVIGPDLADKITEQNRLRNLKRTLAKTLLNLPSERRLAHLQTIVNSLNTGRELTEQEHEQLSIADMLQGMVKLNLSEESFRASAEDLINVQTQPLRRKQF